MNREEVRARIEEIGVIPAVRFRSAEDARFATEAVAHGGIPIVEITMTVPGAVELISDLARNSPDVIVGAGTLFDKETASRCLDAGARFLTSPGLDEQIVEFAIKKEVVVLAGALTTTEVTKAWKADPGRRNAPSSERRYRSSSASHSPSRRRAVMCSAISIVVSFRLAGCPGRAPGRRGNRW